MSNTDRDSMLERWADGMEKLEQYYEGKYGPPATPPSLPPITTYDAMLEAIADGMERAKRNINKKSPTYHSDSVAYVKTVPAGNVHYASLEQIGGKTVIWNQLADSGTTSVVTISGHKYYTLIDGTASIVNGGSAITIVDDTADMVCDLTLMYGSGNEPSTASEFTAQFPASYYTYNAGTLLSAGVTEVKSAGRNLFYSTTNSYSSTPNGIAVNWNKDTQTITMNGTNTKTDSAWIALNLDSSIDLVAGESYIISSNGSPTLSTGLYLNVTYYDTNGVLKAFTLSNGTFTVPADYGSFRHVQIGVYKTATTINTTIKIQIEKGSTATEYVPYANPLSIYPIPASVQALEGYGWSAGSVYNYVDFERKVFVKCVGAIDLGTVDFSALSTPENHIFRATLSDFPNIKPPANNNYTVNAISSMYMVMAYNPISANDNLRFSVSVEANNRVVFINQAYSTVDSFTSAMSGVYLYYELATPQETDISAYLTDDNLIEVESGGTLTFENQHGDDYRIPVPSSVTFVVGEP